MKKLLLACTVALSTLSSFAQGTVVFNNDLAHAVRTNVLGNSGPVLSTMDPRVTMWYSTAESAPTIPSLANGFDFTGWTLSSPTTPDTLLTGVNQGRFIGGTQTTDGAVAGSTPWVIVAGWTGGFANWSSAYNAALSSGVFLGVTTNAWQQPTGNPQGAPPTTPQALILGPGGFNGLELSIVPEPSTFALCGLGVIAMAYFSSRRKQD